MKDLKIKISVDRYFVITQFSGITVRAIKFKIIALI